MSPRASSKKRKPETVIRELRREARAFRAGCDRYLNQIGGLNKALREMADARDEARKRADAFERRFDSLLAAIPELRSSFGAEPLPDPRLRVDPEPSRGEKE